MCLTWDRQTERQANHLIFSLHNGDSHQHRNFALCYIILLTIITRTRQVWFLTRVRFTFYEIHVVLWNQNLNVNRKNTGIIHTVTTSFILLSCTYASLYIFLIALSKCTSLDLNTFNFKHHWVTKKKPRILHYLFQELVSTSLKINVWQVSKFENKIMKKQMNGINAFYLAVTCRFYSEERGHYK